MGGLATKFRFIAKNTLKNAQTQSRTYKMVAWSKQSTKTTNELCDCQTSIT